MPVHFDVTGASATQYTYLTLGSPVVTAPPFTFFAWINPDSFAGGLGAAIINMERMPTGFGGANHYILGLTASTDAVPNRVFIITDGALGSPQVAYSATEYSLNQWQSAACVMASYSSIKAYLDGVPGTENTNTSPDISSTLEATLIGLGATSSVGTFNKPVKGCYGYCYAWDIALTDSEIALLHAGAPPNTIQSGNLVMALDMLTPATAGANGAGSDFTIVDGINGLGTCADSPPIEEPEPPAPEAPGTPGYFIERMDNRIWPTIEQAWCLDSALDYPMPEPDATLSVSSATGDQSITEYNIINGGSGYTDPQAQVIDLLGTGSGALCDLGISGGVIVSATALTVGENYGHPTVSVLDTTGVGAVIQPIVTNYVTCSTNTSSFTASDVGSIIRVGGGRLEIVTVSSTTSVIANVISPITYTVPNDPNNTPVPATSGNWSMTAPTMTVSGLHHLEGLTVAALADGGVVRDLVVTDGAVTLPVEATQIVVGLPFVVQLQTMYMDAGAGPTVQTRRKELTQAVLRVEASRAPEIGANQPDAAAQPNQAEIPWGGVPYTGMTQIKDRTPAMPAGQPIPLFSGDLDITNVFTTWDAKAQIAVQQRDPVPLTVTAIVPWVKVGDTPGQ